MSLIGYAQDIAAVVVIVLRSPFAASMRFLDQESPTLVRARQQLDYSQSREREHA